MIRITQALSRFAEGRACHPLPLISLLLVVISVLVADKLVFPSPSGMGMPEITLEVPPKAAKPAYDAHAARLVWNGTALAQALAFLWSIAFFCYSIVVPPWIGARYKRSISYRSLAVASGIALLIAAGVTILGRLLGPNSGLNSMHWTAVLLRNAQTESGAEHLGYLVDVFNGAAGLVIVLGTLAVCFAVAMPQDKSHDEISPASHDFSGPIRRLENLATVCAVVFVIGVLQIDAQFRWVASLAKPDGDPVRAAATLDAARGVADAVSLLAGIFFATAMTFVFGSAALLMCWRIDGEIQNLSKSQPWKDWRSELGVGFSITDFFVQFSKLASPALAGMLAGFLNFKA